MDGEEITIPWKATSKGDQSTTTHACFWRFAKLRDSEPHVFMRQSPKCINKL
jgi:hypothetical protein